MNVFQFGVLIIVVAGLLFLAYNFLTRNWGLSCQECLRKAEWRRADQLREIYEADVSEDDSEEEEEEEA